MSAKILLKCPSIVIVVRILVCSTYSLYNLVITSLRQNYVTRGFDSHMFHHVLNVSECVLVLVCYSVRACVRACARACVRACVRARVHIYAPVCVCARERVRAY